MIMNENLYYLLTVLMCFNLSYIEDAFCSCKHATTGLYLDLFVVIATLQLTKYLLYNHNGVTSTTAMNPSYDVQDITV